ncbi:hypothetical protein [Psychrobacillus sp. NPDC096623]|uniref:hypothetical protein n=1 Tax=Psychrobacillus sp. NPDC096623 TaxID=3364492 RepID=UPI0037F44CB7
MKESKVHLVSAALEKNNSQKHFYTNHHIEFLEEQTSVNQLLLNSVSQLDQSSKTILRELHDQRIILDKLNTNHRYDYGNIKKILLNFAQTSKETKFQLQKLSQTLQAINVHWDNQSEFNEITDARTENLEKALKNLQGSVNRQRNFLNNFAIEQNNFFENIKGQFDQREHQSDTRTKTIQDVLEEQKRFFTMISKNLEEQNLLHDLIINQFKEQKALNSRLSEKLELSDELDELILEEIKLQITQQDDIYNYLQDSLNRQQGFLLQLSDNQNRQLEKVKISLENIREVDAQQVDALLEVKESIEKLL